MSVGFCLSSEPGLSVCNVSKTVSIKCNSKSVARTETLDLIDVDVTAYVRHTALSELEHFLWLGLHGSSMATSLANASSGLGAIDKAWSDSRIALCSAGDHLFFKLVKLVLSNSLG